MRRAFAVLFASAAALSTATIARDARASAVAYPEGSYARVKRESAIVSWDAPHKSETVVFAISVEGDAPNVAALIPMPPGATVRLVAPAADTTLARVIAFAKPPPSPLDGDSLKAHTAANATLATLDRADADPVKRWLDDHKLVAKQGVLEWAALYGKRGWGMAMVEVPRAEGSGRRNLTLPEVSMKFTVDAPIVPYADPEPDFTAHNAYLARAGLCGADGGACAAPWERSFDVYVAADSAARAARADGVGPMLTQVMEAPPIVFQQIFAGQNPRFKPWTLTHFVDASSTHQGTDDFAIATLDTSAAAMPASARAPALGGAKSKSSGAHHHPARVLFGLVALLAALGIGIALRSERV